MPQQNSNRLNLTRAAMAEARAAVLVVTHLPNVFYLCGFTGSNAILIVFPDDMHLFTDGRYTIQARAESPGARIHIERGPLHAICGAFLADRTRKTRMRAGYDPAHLNLIEWHRMKKSAGPRVQWRPAAGLIEGLREVKDAAELATMREAAKLGSDVMAEVIALARPGVTEIDLAAEIDFRMRRKGADGVSFESIVASGPRSALPHARPTAKRLGKNELVVLDLGAILRHYCSDLTRTVYIGRAPGNVRRWYRAVELAQQAALQAVRSGVAAGSVDRAARTALRRNGLARHFVHSTGHGLGIEVHESPRLGKGQTQKIAIGNVITLEPGIYMEGVGGIRIEDDVAVHSGGTEVLTSAPTGLIEI